jgi:uroporphyrinogen decarboxylase
LRSAFTSGPPEPDQAGNYDWTARDIAKFGAEYFLMASGYMGVYERCYGLLSIPTMFELMVTELKLTAELLEKITDYKVGVAKNFVKMKLDIGDMSDDLGTQTGPFVPPRIFTDLLLPQYKRLFKVYKDAGWLMAMHSCGCITKFLPELIEVGLDVLEPVQPCMDLSFIKKEYGKHLTFWGGIDTQQLLPFGPPDDVRRDVAKAIRLMGKGGGHIIAPSQEVMKDVPLANIVAMLGTILVERASAHGL